MNRAGLLVFVVLCLATLLIQSNGSPCGPQKGCLKDCAKKCRDDFQKCASATDKAFEGTCAKDIRTCNSHCAYSCNSQDCGTQEPFSDTEGCKPPKIPNRPGGTRCECPKPKTKKYNCYKADTNKCVESDSNAGGGCTSK